MPAFPITAYALSNALGSSTDRVLQQLRRGETGLAPSTAHTALDLPFPAFVGALRDPLPELPPALRPFETRQARVLHALMGELDPALARARQQWGPARIGVALGTSTAGMAETEQAYASHRTLGEVPPSYSFRRHHLPDAMLTVARLATGFQGPALVISTACSSSAKVFGTAQRWLDLDLCDAVLVGGVDTLCGLTLRGFHSLELISPTPCRPLSAERSGLSIGEGGGLALLERTGKGKALLLGVGETSDAHHMTAPHPEGVGAIAAMRAALAQGGRSAAEVDHINAHGTGTRLNDAVEGLAIAKLFGDRVPVASTKGYTGHMLGAAGITEALFSVAAIEQGWLPKSVGAEPVDATLGIQVLTAAREQRVRCVLSNSFAFGGSNAALLFGDAAP